MLVELIYKELGNHLRRARKSANLSQQSLADRVGLSRTSITNIERGRQRIPIHMLYMLANAVGVNPSDLLPDKDLVSSSHILDDKVKKKESLEEELMHWMRRVVSSGITEEVGDEKANETGEAAARRA